MIMWLTILEIILASGIIGVIVATYNRHRDSHGRIERSLRLQHRRDMKALYEKCLVQQYVSDHDDEDFQEMFDLYTEMNGNSYAKKLKCRFDLLKREGE